MKRLSLFIFIAITLWHVEVQAREISFGAKDGRMEILLESGYSDRVMTLGTFEKFQGLINFKSARPEESYARLSITTKSINSGNFLRDAFLKSGTILNTSRFPEAKFVSTSVKFSGAKTATVSGKLTLRGVTKPITFKIKFDRTSDHQLRNLTSKARFLASDFGIPGFSFANIIVRFRVWGFHAVDETARASAD